LLLLTGMGGSAFLSVTNIIEDPGVADEVKFEEPSFHGRIDATLDSNYLTPSPSAVPKLVIEDEDERAEKIDAAKTHAERAWDLTLRDTRSSYNEALTDVKKAIEYDPQKAELTSLKISILALRETINDRGETSFKSSDSGRELKNAGQDLLRKTVMQRARAHVLVNSGKSEAAKSLAEEYYREHQTDALACYVLAMTYRHQKKPDLKKTVKYLEEAIKHERGFIRARWELAAAYRDQNRYDDARRTYTAILKMAPDRKGTAEAMERLAERDVAKTKKPIAKGPDKGRPKPVTKPKTPVKAEPEGIRGTGSSLSDSVVGSIKSVDRYMKRYKPKGGKSSNGRPTRPRPPEEGPKPRPPEEGP